MSTKVSIRPVTSVNEDLPVIYGISKSVLPAKGSGNNRAKTTSASSRHRYFNDHHHQRRCIAHDDLPYKSRVQRPILWTPMIPTRSRCDKISFFLTEVPITPGSSSKGWTKVRCLALEPPTSLSDDDVLAEEVVRKKINTTLPATTPSKEASRLNQEVGQIYKFLLLEMLVLGCPAQGPSDSRLTVLGEVWDKLIRLKSAISPFIATVKRFYDNFITERLAMLTEISMMRAQLRQLKSIDTKELEATITRTADKLAIYIAYVEGENRRLAMAIVTAQLRRKRLQLTTCNQVFFQISDDHVNETKDVNEITVSQKKMFAPERYLLRKSAPIDYDSEIELLRSELVQLKNILASRTANLQCQFVSAIDVTEARSLLDRKELELANMLDLSSEVRKKIDTIRLEIVAYETRLREARELKISREREYESLKNNI